MQPLRVLLNSAPAGPHAGFFLAEADGHLAAEGLAVTWLSGSGAAAVVEDMDDALCDAAFGDLSVLVARLGHAAAGLGPQAVYVAFNRTPLTIAVAADGPVRQPRDLAGRRVSGHARDAAWRIFATLAAVTGLDAAHVQGVADPAPLAEQVRKMLEEGAAEGVFGFVNTIIASLEAARLPLAHRLRFLEYAAYLPELYGNALIVSRRMIETEPQRVRGLVHALTRGMVAAIADPARGVAAVQRRHPALDLAVDTNRLRGTLAREMAHPERFSLGLGAVDPARLARGIALLAASLGLPRVPAPAEVFNPVFLPPLAARGWPGAAPT